MYDPKRHTSGKDTGFLTDLVIITFFVILGLMFRAC